MGLNMAHDGCSVETWTYTFEAVKPFLVSDIHADLTGACSRRPKELLALGFPVLTRFPFQRLGKMNPSSRGCAYIAL